MAWRHLVAYTQEPCSFWEIDFDQGLQIQADRCRTKYSRNWWDELVHIWPEFKTSSDGAQASDADAESSDTSEHTKQAVSDGERSDEANFKDHSEHELSGGYETEDNGGPPYERTEGDRGDATSVGAPSSGVDHETTPMTVPPPVHVGSMSRTPQNERVVGDFLWDNSKNILSGDRRTRRGRGMRQPDQNFPMVTSFTPTPERKKQRKNL